MRKSIAGLITLAMILTAFAGLFTASAEGAENVVSMAVSGSVSELALRYETAELYEKLNPGTKIEWIDLGDDRVTKTMTLISSGAAPDILYLNENIYTYTTKNILAPLTPYIEAEGDGYLDYFYDSLLNLLTWQDELYALPQEVSPYVVYYNKDLLNAYGIAEPTDDWTFDQWDEMLVQISEAGREDLVYGQNIQLSWPDQYCQMFSRMGVEIYNEDATELWIAQPENREATLKAFNWIYDKVYVQKVCPNPAEVTAMGQGYNQMFRNQQVVFQSAGLWDLPTYADEPLEFEWDVVRCPIAQDGRRIVRAGILNWGIWSGSDNKDAAWDVLKFFVGHEGQMIVAKHNMALPAAHDDEANQLIIDSKFPANVEAFVKSVDDIYQVDSYSLCEEEASNIINSELQAMVLGEQTPEETLDNIIESVSEVLADALEANS